ncbi:putative membrane protein, hemolysin III [Sphaerochaeta pleomorpha str. Grapes]|uniref:Putative membrane protein, hemolysin III n=1 Tax=Sphaerochaeta pleomorpha (strain ATCC BAA-1885 / DSM 22778 / Grapes) TaxID=158190 RepID=G8QUY4_SPHPG|nr:hemolysin III [Sphaerochaeta pleomorpha]AEV28160.1 putative membrane protein, hemolysin III [Sphaerochaeta pleomorpha str. Grapes]
MDELTNVFADFQKQVKEISDHAPQVHKIEFSAKLKNGTSFNFNFNSDTFNRQPRSERNYKPVSVFNAIVDIIGASGAIFLLVYLIITIETYHPTFGSSAIWSILAFSFFIAFFTISSVYHLFDKDSPVQPVFYSVSESLKIVTLASVNICYVLLVNPEKFIPAVLGTLGLAAASFLFLSIGTHGGLRASLAFTTLLPFVSLLGKITLLSVSTAILLALWSLINLLVKPSQKVRTNTVFAIMGMISLALNCFLVLEI